MAVKLRVEGEYAILYLDDVRAANIPTLAIRLRARSSSRAERMTAVGMGGSEPVVEGDSRKERLEARRVVIVRSEG